MEFNGILGSDFDFFKKKDKMSKEDYEKGRNEVKLHFRSLCYELQKMYHKKTGGVLELDKEFQNFNRRSTNISVEHKNNNDKFKSEIIMNCDNINSSAVFTAENHENAQYILDIMKAKRKMIWDYAMTNKFMVISIEYFSKDKKSIRNKLSSLDINAKNYDNFISVIEGYVKDEKFNFRIEIGYVYSKNECLKQGKSLAVTIYDTISNLQEMIGKIQ
jgi:hypothetical protein